MPITIDLPDSNSATLRSSEELSNRSVKELRRAARKVGIVGQHLKDLGLDDIRADVDAAEDVDPESDEAKAAAEATNARALAVLTQISDEEDDSLDLFQRTAAAIRLIDWTLDLPLPKTAEDVDNLPRPLYEALTTEAAKLDLNESFSKEAHMAADDPKAPDTQESADSSSPSEEVSP